MDYHKIKKFGAMIVKRNNKIGNFNSELLRKKIIKHIQSSVISYNVKRFFYNGYGIKQYLSYFRHGMFFEVSIKNNLRFLAKSILLKSI